ncbi:MAG: phosphoribosylaminoimidazolesuccinocarboxamide synthase [Myxococcota bacterium]
MGMDPGLIREQRRLALSQTDLSEFGEPRPGKVRDSYVRGSERILVATDRVSCFDVVVDTIPFKGQVLNQLAAFWFERTRESVPNHLIAVPDPVVQVVRECRVLPVEFVVRGYLTGSSPTSIATVYREGVREYCGHTLPEGLELHAPLPRPLVTPTTKAARGEHDQLTSRAELISRGTLSEDVFDRAAAWALRLFGEGQRFGESRGLILADTKYEFGIDAEGDLRVVDEIHTPDSSRYWYRAGYERALAEGTNPEALDKEYVRRWLVSRGWRGIGPPPTIDEGVVCEAARRYVEAYETLTGLPFEPSLEPPIERIRRHLAAFFASRV